MRSTMLRSRLRRVMVGAVVTAGMTAGLALGSGSTAAAAPLPPLPSSADVTGMLNQATSALNSVAGAIQGLQSLDFGSVGSLGLGGVVRPAGGPISQHFGGAHRGIDIAAPMGAPIFAVADGTVINAGPASGFGLWIRIRHNDGTITTYGHNDVNFVSVGQWVRAGQRIGNVGNRGQSTGPHLHFEVDLPGGFKTDPVAWLAARGAFMF